MSHSALILEASPFPQSTLHSEKTLEFCLGVYSALDFCLRNWLISVYGISVPLLCSCPSTPSLCPRADFLPGHLFIAWHRLGTLWRARAGQQVYPCYCFLCSLPSRCESSPQAPHPGLCWPILACSHHWAGSVVCAPEVLRDMGS